jgi:hypothetical protein
MKQLHSIHVLSWYTMNSYLCEHMVVLETFGGLSVVLDYNYFTFSSALAPESMMESVEDDCNFNQDYDNPP